MSGSKSKRQALFGMLTKYPYSPCRSDCPVNNAREHLTLEEKKEYIASLDDAEISKIIEYHQRCPTN